MTKTERKILEVPMGGMKAASNEHTLRSSGVGSCVVVTLYDPIQKVGAMAHPMLDEHPEKTTFQALSLKQSEKEWSSATPLRFVGSAIDAMIVALKGLGGIKDRFEAKVIGGANMFKVFDNNPKSIGLHNAEAAKKKLEKEGIAIIANDTGGSVGRSVTFNLKTGMVEVKTNI